MTTPPPDPDLDAPPAQHHVLRQLTVAVGGVLARGLRESIGRKVPVHFAWEKRRRKKEHVTLIQYWLEPATRELPMDRVHCVTADGVEYFRAPPLLLTARYLVTAWAEAPDDQELLVAAARVLHDHPTLEPSDGGADDVVHWEDRPTLELAPAFTFDDGQRVCRALDIPLRPSLRYDLPFRVDSESKTPIKRVQDRTFHLKNQG